MIVIGCSGETNFGGRTSDTFVIEELNSLDELHDYIKTNQPVMAKQPTEYYKYTIIKKESLRDRLVYLNNYLHIKQLSYYVMDEKELEYINENICKTCEYNDGTLSSCFLATILQVPKDVIHMLKLFH
ncbi:hypothetical protein AB1283_26155 [Bacillus sp. S13(2024)]|uniref:hypothetical protein n=1 Tax=Bacillus sp. S13(2024) TaxID=3162885 RepID=UPI003D20EB7F